MPNLDLPILVVDDAKFSSMVVGRTLRNAGYRDVRIVNNAPEALKLIEQRPVSVLIADWLMPEMDGLELTDQVRQQDEQNNHYTYVILLTARESVEALSEAFDRGVDDFIYKSDMTKQLIPRIFAADRMADRQNTLLRANSLLIENNRELESTNIIDLETGLCNTKYGRERLTKTLRHAESRGGASAYVLCGIRNWQELKRKHPPTVMSELAERHRPPAEHPDSSHRRLVPSGRQPVRHHCLLPEQRPLHHHGLPARVRRHQPQGPENHSRLYFRGSRHGAVQSRRPERHALNPGYGTGRGARAGGCLRYPTVYRDCAGDWSDRLKGRHTR